VQTATATTDETVIWRYLSAERLRDVLSGSLYFAAATQFDDAFEGAITDAQFAKRRAQSERFLSAKRDVDAALQSTSRAFAELRRLTKISCWHASDHENVSMWERYLPKGTCGVAVRSTVGSLKSALLPFRLEPRFGEEGIVVRKVQYLDFSKDEFPEQSMEAPFFFKRIEYRDEQEVRAVLSLRMAEEFGVQVPDLGVSVGVDPGQLIAEVRVGPVCTNSDVRRVQEMMQAEGVFRPAMPSTLSRRPVY